MIDAALIPLVSALVVAAFVSGFILKHLRALAAQQPLEKKLAVALQQVTDSKDQLDKALQQQQILQEKHHSLAARFNQVSTRLSEREAVYETQLQQFEMQKSLLKKEFENLANKVFEDKQKIFSDHSQHSLSLLLKPFREQIDGFQRRVNDVHSESIQGHTSLQEEIKKVMDVGLKMQSEANNLTAALKGDSQKRGAWGEAQLHRTLEMSGLIEDAHFSKQSAFRDKDGKLKQTDYIIKLPDQKHIIIDSKVTLNAYAKFCAAESEEAQALALQEHATAVKKHCDDLASKNYTNVIGMHSPSFVLMFMPIEPAYIAALQYRKQDLFAYAYEKNIILVSHTTLIPILKTVANLWMLETSHAEVKEISERAGEIYNQLCTVAERFNRLGISLSAVNNHYNQSVTALSGQQGLHGKIERFNQLSSKVSKSMPDLNHVHIDVQRQKLQVMLETEAADETTDSANI